MKNVEKLSQTLNNVWFGHLKVWAREARFDPFVHNDSKPLVVSRSVGQSEKGKEKREKVRGAAVREKKSVRPGKGVVDAACKGVSGEGEKSVRLGGQVDVRVSGEGGKNKGVERVSGTRKLLVTEVVTRGLKAEEKVGGVSIVLGGQSRKDIREISLSAPLHTDVVQPTKKCVLMYRSVPEDRSWTSSGIMATVVTGKSMFSIKGGCR